MGPSPIMECLPWRRRPPVSCSHPGAGGWAGRASGPGLLQGGLPCNLLALLGSGLHGGRGSLSLGLIFVALPTHAEPPQEEHVCSSSESPSDGGWPLEAVLLSPGQGWPAPPPTVLPVVPQSPVSSLQSVRHDLPPEPADGTRLSAYCPDYTVRALSDLQFIKVTIWVARQCFVSLRARPAGHRFVWLQSKFFCFHFWLPLRHTELLGQGSDLCHSHDLSRSCSNARSPTHCAVLGIKPHSPLLPRHY